MSGSQSLGHGRRTRQPWFGVVVAIVSVAVVFVGCFALKSVGDSRIDSAGRVGRLAAGEEPLAAMRMTLTNSSSVTMFVNAINVIRSDWTYPAPDENQTDALKGRWIDPGETVSVEFGIRYSTRQSRWDLSTLPVSRSSTGGAITFYPQTNSPGGPGEQGIGYHHSFWYWPTSARPGSVQATGCSPTWSGPAGQFTDSKGGKGSITATATCSGDDAQPMETTTHITFTETRS